MREPVADIRVEPRIEMKSSRCECIGCGEEGADHDSPCACKHLWHEECVTQWFHYAAGENCSVCRQPIGSFEHLPVPSSLFLAALGLATAMLFVSMKNVPEGAALPQLVWLTRAVYGTAVGIGTCGALKKLFT